MTTNNESLRHKQVRFVLKQQEWAKNPLLFCEEVLGFKPQPHQIRIMEMVRDNKKVAIASSHCVGYDETIILADGTLVKSQDLIGQEFQILSFDPKTGQQMPQRAIAEDNGLQQCYKITTTTGKEIVRTYNHPLYAADFKTGRFNKGKYDPLEPIGWTEAQYLKPNMPILCPNKLEIEPTKFDFTDDECKLLGYLLGDGSTTDSVSFTQMDGEPKEEFKQIVENLGCKLSEYTKDCDSLATNLKVSGKKDENGKFETNYILKLVRDWGLFGCSAKTKRFPSFVWQLPDRQIALILNRFFACDGYAYINKTKRYETHVEKPVIGITLANKDLIKDIEFALLRLGITPSFIRYKPSKCNGKTFDAWDLAIYKQREVLNFISQVGIFGKEDKLENCKQAALAQKSNKIHKWMFDKTIGNSHWEKISKIEPITQQSTVCITVNNTETYVTSVFEHNSVGKSSVSAVLALWFFITNFQRLDEETLDLEDVIVMITAPTFDQIKDSVFKEINDKYKKANEYLAKEFGFTEGIGGKFYEGKNEAFFKFDIKNYIKGRSSDKPGNLSGGHARNVLIIIDEAAEVPDPIFGPLEGTLISGNTKLLCLGNPTNIGGVFYNAFGDISDYKTWNISAFDTPNFTAPDIKLEDMFTDNWKSKLGRYCKVSNKGMTESDWIQAILKKLPAPYLVNPIAVHSILVKCGMNPNDPEFQGRVLGAFPTQTSRSLIPVDWYKLSNDRYDNPDYFEDGPIVFGVDVSTGDSTDNSVVAILQGNKFLPVLTFKLNTNKFSQKIKELYEEYQPSVIKIEKDGIGAGVYHNLLEWELPVIPVIMGGGAGIEGDVNQKEKKQLYSRKRDEVWWEFREKLNPHSGLPSLLIPKDLELARQAHAMTYRKLTNGKIKVADKEELKSVLKKSPDELDAMAIATANIDDGDPFASCDFVGYAF